MTSDTISNVENRLQVISLALESIDADTDISIVIQRLQNCNKQIQFIGKLLREGDSGLNASIGQTSDATTKERG